MHRTTRSATFKDTTISNEKNVAETQKSLHNTNEENSSEARNISELSNEKNEVTSRTSQNREETSEQEKRADTEIIAYVESVSPSKRNRRDTTDYSDITFQLHGGKKRRAVCFSERKRLLLLERKNNKTAVKLSKFNIAKDSATVYINDMTYISKPRPEEYSFQFEDKSASCSANWMTLKEALECCEEMQLVNIKAKVIDISETQLVSQKQLRMAHCVISDGEATTKLVLWEKDVNAVQRGKAFNFEQLRVRMENNAKVLNTTKNTVINENNDENLKKVEAKDFNLESNIKTINVSKIDMIEHFSINKVCLKCNKHIIQNTSDYILKCDFCKYTMRKNSCKSSVVVKIVVTDSSLPSNNNIHLVIFHNELVQLLKTEEVYDEQFVSLSLFKLENLKITFENKRNVVKNIEQL